MTARVLLYWLPLGAGGRSVRWNGRIFEAVLAHHERRAAKSLYHSALEVTLGCDRFIIEMAPVWSNREADRGVVQEGPVGARWLGRSALFRYEVRVWRGGRIPDVSEAVGGPRCVGVDPASAQALVDLAPQVPPLTWGRDESARGPCPRSRLPSGAHRTRWGAGRPRSRTDAGACCQHPPGAGRSRCAWSATRCGSSR